MSDMCEECRQNKVNKLGYMAQHDDYRALIKNKLLCDECLWSMIQNVYDYFSLRGIKTKDDDGTPIWKREKDKKISSEIEQYVTDERNVEWLVKLRAADEICERLILYKENQNNDGERFYE